MLDHRLDEFTPPGHVYPLPGFVEIPHNLLSVLEHRPLGLLTFPLAFQLLEALFDVVLLLAEFIPVDQKFIFVALVFAVLC